MSDLTTILEKGDYSDLQPVEKQLFATTLRALLLDLQIKEHEENRLNRSFSTRNNIRRVLKMIQKLENADYKQTILED